MAHHLLDCKSILIVTCSAILILSIFIFSKEYYFHSNVITLLNKIPGQDTEHDNSHLSPFIPTALRSLGLSEIHNNFSADASNSSTLQEQNSTILVDSELLSPSSRVIEFDKPVEIPEWARLHFMDDEEEASRRKPLDRDCDIYDGRWVYDASYPLWDPMTNLTKNTFGCSLLGRSDTEYLKLRWQPRGCNIPRFNASEFLDHMRDRRIAFIGDSLSYNQFYSLVGMLSKGSTMDKIHQGRGNMFPDGRRVLSAFLFDEYNVSVEMYNAGFLVEHIPKPPGSYSDKVKSLLDIGRVSRAYDKILEGLDVAVFNGGHWFHPAKLSESGLFPYINGTVDFEMTPMDLFRHAMLRWASWLEVHRNHDNVIFFRSFEPVHGQGWLCPSEHPRWPQDNAPIPPLLQIQSEVIRNIPNPPLFLNITYLSALRNDGHVTLAGKHRDCSHWCTPGVPDTWNELMYAALLQKRIEKKVRSPPVMAPSSTPELEEAKRRIPEWAKEEFVDDPLEASRRLPLSKACNIYDGKWVYDESYPLWEPQGPVEGNTFICSLIGREDTDFLKLRWQPNGCNLPRFNASFFLESMRNRRIAFIGDSLAKNQFYSLAGLLSFRLSPEQYRQGKMELFPDHRRVQKAFIFYPTNTSLELYSSGYLVGEIREPAGYPPEVKALLEIEKVDTSFDKIVRGVDLAVFNAGHWFSDAKLSRRGCYPIVNGSVDLTMEVMDVYKMSLETWARWFDSLTDVTAQVFYRGYEPYHGGGRGMCPSIHPNLAQTRNLALPAHVNIVEDVLSRMQRPPTYLNITKLSSLRNDAHLRGVTNRGDCSHWCTPGVPDTWNELMFAEMVQNGRI